MTFQSNLKIEKKPSGLPKLTAEDVVEIRKRLEAGQEFYYDLAKEYGISKNRVYQILRGKRS